MVKLPINGGRKAITIDQSEALRWPTIREEEVEAVGYLFLGFVICFVLLAGVGAVSADTITVSRLLKIRANNVRVTGIGFRGYALPTPGEGSPASYGSDGTIFEDVDNARRSS